MMARFVLWRLLSALLLLWLASMLIFFTLTLAPGDAAVQALGEHSTPQALQTLRHQFGLDRPVAARYWQWLNGILRGDPGISLTSQQPVVDIIAPAARRSALLALIGGCYLLRMIRASLIRLTDAPNILSASLNGVRGLTLVARHFLPQAAGPLAQLFAASLPYLIGGAVVVERVFGFPGLGELLLTALNTRDAILLQGVAMLLALITALCWFAADVLAVWLDPWRRRS
ncbi:ABC transporter permease [Salmonella enterica]|nr:ABC transporter permease [Salmonella enterica]